MGGQEWVEAACLVALALVHALSPSLRFLSAVPRSIWLSAAGGVSVAYVFVHLLPELAEGQRSVGEEVTGALARVENHVYLVALAGLAVFYGVEWASRTSRDARREREGEDRTDPAVFWLSIGSFALYNALTGYILVHREEDDVRGLVFFAVAIGVHVLVTDAGLLRHHGHDFRRLGRWLLIAALVAGYALGLGSEISDAALAVLIAFLGGGVVLNVLKEEVPTEQGARFLPFVTGAAAYAALLLAA